MPVTICAAMRSAVAAEQLRDVGEQARPQRPPARSCGCPPDSPRSSRSQADEGRRAARPATSRPTISSWSSGRYVHLSRSSCRLQLCLNRCLSNAKAPPSRDGGASMLRGTTLVPADSCSGPALSRVSRQLVGRCNGRFPSPAIRRGGSPARLRSEFGPALPASHRRRLSECAALLLSVAASTLLFVGLSRLRLVELRGIEPLTSTLPVWRSPS